MDSQPIKRSPQLSPLSREHHDGLLFAWKIRQGIKLRKPLEEMRSYTMWFWKHHIKPHFFQEEKILLPFMPEENPLRHRLVDEHEHIRELVLGLDDEADVRSLTILCDLLDNHIRFEERELFGYLEQTLTQEQLSQIYKKLEEHPVDHELEWKHPFWEA